MEYKGVLIGLGNPGKKYEGTRHNCGFSMLSDLLEIAGATGVVSKLNGDKFSCELWRVTLPRLKGIWLCARPLTFMNNSGDCAQPLLAWHKIPPDRMVVAHDELDIPAGELRFKLGGGNAGHNGLESISGRLGTPDFYRLRIGIGRPLQKNDVIHWVLGRPDAAGATILRKAVREAIEILLTFADKGLQAAAIQARAVRPAPPS